MNPFRIQQLTIWFSPINNLILTKKQLTINKKTVIVWISAVLKNAKFFPATKSPSYAVFRPVVRLQESSMANLRKLIDSNCDDEKLVYRKSAVRSQDGWQKINHSAWCLSDSDNFKGVGLNQHMGGRMNYGSANYASMGMWRDSLGWIPPIWFFLVEIPGAGLCRGGAHTLHDCVR